MCPFIWVKIGKFVILTKILHNFIFAYLFRDWVAQLKRHFRNSRYASALDSDLCIRKAYSNPQHLAYLLLTTKEMMRWTQYLGEETASSKFLGKHLQAIIIELRVAGCTSATRLTGMTNYPIGPHRTQSDPIGPHWTPSHSTSYFLPPTTGQSFILSLACTLQTQ